MIRMPLASVSLLAIAISLAACNDDKPAAGNQSNTPPAATAPVAAEQNTGAAASTQSAKVDEAAARAVISNYADIAAATFGDALETAKTLQTAINAFLETPSAETQQAAKDAWIAARVPYMQVEVFRFGNTFVDDWEGQVNSWPLDEGLIDYVAEDTAVEQGNPAGFANIIANSTIQVGEDEIDVSDINGEALAELNELAGSEANVATGYHAIEFLLWGQDLHEFGPGAGERPWTDYLVGEGATGGNNERRRTYLREVTKLLVHDLIWMSEQWQANVKDNYRAKLESESVEDGLRKIFFGMGSLSLGELAGERMKVALEAHSTEDEHDCFSDNTHNSHFYNGLGIRNVYLGEYKTVDGRTISGVSLSSLVGKVDADTDKALKEALDASMQKLQVLVDSANNGEYFDQLIAPENEAGQAKVRDAIGALVAQTRAIEKAASAIGVSDLEPDSADHEF